ncbi:MAG: O-antigen ligase family protein [Flavobacteriales bacterium]|nr:O-antigen ligase family protein [Flavobacteriales bacterium]
MVKLFKSYWIYLFSFLFIAVNSYMVINEMYYFALIPFALVLVFMAFFNLDKLMWFIVFTTPLSLNLEELEMGGVGMYLPTEPLIFGIMLLYFLKLIQSRTYNKRMLYHPVTIAVLFNLFWILVTSFTSEMPVVSFKFLLARLWFVVCFYFLATQLFKEIKNYKVFYWAYIIPLAFVVVYSVIRLAGYGFEEQPAHWVMEPFYKDHTSYGAILAMYFPILFLFMGRSYPSYVKIFSYVLFGVFTVGVILSYTRAAWVSLIAAFVLFIIYRLRVRFSVLAVMMGILGIMLFLSWDRLMINLERNNQDSSDELAEHVESISNVSTDASNLERLNRWSSAWRMFKQRPFLGWGPGTYVFQYAPFQLSNEKTIISTNAGENGNAHSEYIGPLAESGVIGTVSFLLIVLAVYYRGSLLYHRLPKGELKAVVLASLLGLFTYVVHGFLNNYLDTDKASVPFWGMIAIIVAIDVYHSQESLDTHAE